MTSSGATQIFEAGFHELNPLWRELTSVLVAGVRIERTSLWLMRPGGLPAVFPRLKWSAYKDLNFGPPAPKAGALPGCAIRRKNTWHPLKESNFQPLVLETNALPVELKG